MDDQGRLDVAGVRRGADGVEIALPEFAVTAVLRVLAAPHRPHVIALERRAEFADVLRGEAGERHRQVEAQRHVAVAVILEAVQLPVGLVAPLAEQNFGVFEGRACRWARSRKNGTRGGSFRAAARGGSSTPAGNRGTL